MPAIEDKTESRCNSPAAPGVSRTACKPRFALARHRHLRALPQPRALLAPPKLCKRPQLRLKTAQWRVLCTPRARGAGGNSPNPNPAAVAGLEARLTRLANGCNSITRAPLLLLLRRRFFFGLSASSPGSRSHPVFDSPPLPTTSDRIEQCRAI